MCAQIILLHGASSSGKTTLARALQARIDRPFWHLSIDHLRDGGTLPMDRFRAGDFDWADHRDAIFDGFHASLAACAGAGNDLIVEHILDGDGWAGHMVDILQGHDVLFVGLSCDRQTLRRREAARGDRPIGSAERDYATVHAGRRYDLVLDGTAPVETNVGILLEAWRSGCRSSEFSA